MNKFIEIDEGILININYIVKIEKFEDPSNFLCEFDEFSILILLNDGSHTGDTVCLNFDTKFERDDFYKKIVKGNNIV